MKKAKRIKVRTEKHTVRLSSAKLSTANKKRQWTWRKIFEKVLDEINSDKFDWGK